MPTINSIDSNIPIEIAKGGTNATTMANTDGICYFDGTLINTTAVGTAGQVLTSNGAAVAPTFQNGILFAQRTLTSAEIKSLNGTPISIIPAPGPNKVIVLLSASFVFIYGGSNVFVAAASQTVSLYWTTAVASRAASAVLSTTSITGTTNRYTLSVSGSPSSVLAGVMDNLPILAWNPIATEISGNAANDNSINISFCYVILTI